MENHIDTYKTSLKKAIGEYMEMPINERTAEAVEGMIECLIMLDKACDREKGMITKEEATAWVHEIGEHFDKESLEPFVSRFLDIPVCVVWATMNMLWSDYHKVAKKHGIDTPAFYADLTEAFLYDEDADAPEKKLSEYYRNVAKSHAEQRRS